MDTCEKQDKQELQNSVYDDSKPYVTAYIGQSVIHLSYEELLKSPQLLMADDRIFNIKAIADELCVRLAKLSPPSDVVHSTPKEQQQRFWNEKMKKKMGWGRR